MMRIVCVEDEEIIRQGIIDCIDWEAGKYYFCGEADNGQAGFRLILKERPDIVITDIRIPKMDGLTMIREVKKTYNIPYIIAISGYEDFRYIQEAMRIGFVDYLLKPINVEYMLNLLESLYQKHSQNHEIEKTLLQKMKSEGKDVVNTYRAYCIGILKSSLPIDKDIETDYLLLNEYHIRIESVVKDLCKDYNVDYIMHNNNTEYLIAIMGDTQEQVKQKKGEFTKAISAHPDMLRVRIAYSMVHTHVNHIIEAAKEARDISKRQAFIKNEALLNLGKTYMSNTDEHYDTSGLTNSILQGNLQKMESELNRFTKFLSSLESSSYVIKRMIISRVLFHCIETLAIIDICNSDIEENSEVLFKHIISSDSFAETINHFRNFCRKVCDYVGHNNKGTFFDVIHRAKMFMIENYSDHKLCINDVAKDAMVSTSYLSSILKQELGMSYIEFLTQIRIRKAIQLMHETDKKIYQIAEMCGYDNPTYFSTIFKKRTGLSPSEYMNNLNEDNRQ